MGTRHSGYVRADGDFYSEPPWAVTALLHHVPMCGSIHDPCCGIGTIVDTATSKRLQAAGADIVDRAIGRFPIRDFLGDETSYTNLVFNPPYPAYVGICAPCAVPRGAWRERSRPEFPWDPCFAAKKLTLQLP